MSAGAQEDEDRCGSARERSLERIYHYLDGELEAAEIRQIQTHLDCCTNCQDEYEVEALLKELVKRSCTGSAPEGLRERIQQRIVVERRTTVIRRIDGG
ncbi:MULTISPECIES: mycothiol system anti-sigma-R factor [Brevibacterium]|jgi:mycothiol system anti-sigma-R factor|uniref:Mycothiol system anti-sigma-R factor n=1 Tax=Brevibacterium salitolerans TaxID=1403566 RepID=A0ABP5HXG4_9MICO|nr:mycothiol system anti-sigma-R factor [Brevibacterium sp.]